MRRFVRIADRRARSRTTCTASKIGVLVDFEGGDETLGKDLAMHIAVAASRSVPVEGRGARRT